MGWSAYRATGLTYHQPARSFKGYTLLTPTGGDSTYLLDMDGRIVHRWRSPKTRPFYGRLLPSGNLLLLGTDTSLPPPPHVPITEPQPPFAQHIRRLGGGGTHLHELDWNGEIVWEYANEALHHDFIRLPNGNTLIPLWVELPDDVARRVRGGVRRPREKFPKLISDDIVEVDPAGVEVDRIRLWRALDPVRDPIGPNAALGVDPPQRHRPHRRGQRRLLLPHQQPRRHRRAPRRQAALALWSAGDVLPAQPHGAAQRQHPDLR